MMTGTNLILKEKHMILLFFKKLHKFFGSRQAGTNVSGRSFSQSSKGANDVRNAFKVYFNGPTAAVLSQNQ
jgi:hypothetical protein